MPYQEEVQYLTLKHLALLILQCEWSKNPEVHPAQSGRYERGFAHDSICSAHPCLHAAVEASPPRVSGWTLCYHAALLVKVPELLQCTGNVLSTGSPRFAAHPTAES